MRKIVEYELSIDLNQITAEINSYKQIAGQSIWEIGRRLNHVKENDLAHGEFIKWVNSIGMHEREAQRFIKIASELPVNATTLSHLGESALYLIATLPEEEKQTEIQKASEGSPSTVKELQELKKELKQRDLKITQLEQQPPIEKEVVPFDYENLKSDNMQLSDALKETRKELEAHKERKDFLEKEYNQLLEKRKDVEQDSKEYNELKAAIERMRGQMNEEQQKIAAYSNVAETLKKGNELLDHLSGLVYVDDITILDESDRAKDEISRLVKRVDKWVNDMNQTLKQSNIIEGEIING